MPRLQGLSNELSVKLSQVAARDARSRWPGRGDDSGRTDVLLLAKLRQTERKRSA